MTEINKPPVDLKIAVDQPDHGSNLAPEPPISTIRGMCRGISTDVPKDAECTRAVGDLTTSQATAGAASVKGTRTVTLDDTGACDPPS